jgi:hypothetical protein
VTDTGSSTEADDAHPKDSSRLTLTTRAVSPEAAALVSKLVGLVEDAERQHSGRTYRRGKAAREKLALAVEAMVGGLLLNAGRHGPARWSSQPLGVKAFTGEEVAHRQFNSVRRVLTGRGLVEEKDDHTDFIGKNATIKLRYYTRFRTTAALRSLAEQHGMRLAETARHWRRVRPRKLPDPLTLNELSSRGGKDRGRRLQLPDTAEARAMADEVAAVNAYMQGVQLEGCDPPVFHRGFTHDLSHGGRWYVDDEGYQGLSAADRLLLRIGGEPVAEIDIHASALVTLHGLLKLPLPEGNLYERMGVPKEAAKAWVTQTIGSGKAEGKWARAALRKATKKGGNLTAYDAAGVRAAALRCFPFLGELPRILGCEDEPRLCGLKLARIEADALTAAMRYLRVVHGVPSLPMHDGLIVPVSALWKAHAAIEGAWATLVGVVPRLVTDYPAGHSERAPERATPKISEPG